MNHISELSGELHEKLDLMRKAARKLRNSPIETRNRVLAILEAKLDSHEMIVLDANLNDLMALDEKVPPAFRDRLQLNPERIAAMRESLRQVRALSDPLGEVVESRTLANGLKTRRVRSPLGVIFMVFESRPNVAIEAFSLALKSGNPLILRGGSESRGSTLALYHLIQDSLAEAGLPPELFIGVTSTDREIVRLLLAEKDRIDVVVPRGGERLISFVVENARMPIIKNDRGLCHIYVHSDADLVQAARIAENAKVQRPGVCNSMETLLVHQDVIGPMLDELAKLPGMAKVSYHACPISLPLLNEKFPGSAEAATGKSYATEYLDLVLNVRAVSCYEEAVLHIDRYGSKHSESMLTRDEKLARQFQAEIDAAAVYWNASTRFTDGFELGLGGELGISTQKLHVRGPVGLKELTSIRWVIDGEGQIR